MAKLLDSVLQRLGIRAKVNAFENVEWQLRDADGNVKPLFKDWFLNRLILRYYRTRYTRETAPNQTILNRLLYGMQIPFITGRWVNLLVIPNGVTNAGKAGVASRINGAGAEAAFTYIAVGTGTTAFAAGNTTLETEITDSGLARAAATASRVTTTQTNDTAQNVLTFTVTGTKAVTESGVLNASSSGVLLCRQTFSAINVVNGDSLQVTWKVAVA